MAAWHFQLNGRRFSMIKKAIIFSFIFALFCSIIAPDFANAMGQSQDSQISDEAVFVLLGVGIVAIGVWWYLSSSEDSDSEESYNQEELIKETVEKNISPSGELVILRW
jgi:hypothetical protein